MTEEGEVVIRRRRRWPWLVLLLLGAVLLGLWLARKPIARGEVDGVLKRADVPTRYTIADLGLGRQRLTDVVLGDPADPDLVADWLETRTSWGLRGPYLASVRGGHVRVRARWADGRLSLGSIDRLLPKGERGKPFALPALAFDMEDLRARIETPWGLVGAKLVGSGRLDGGFDGRLAVTSAALAGGDACRATRPEGVWRVQTFAGSPARVALDGSAQAAGLACVGATAGFANVNGTATVTLGDRPSWTIAQDVAATDLRHPAGRARSLAGRVELTGDATIHGPVAVQLSDVTADAARSAQVTLDGTLSQREGRAFAYAGRVGWAGGRWLGRIAVPAAAGTPVAPLLRRLNTAIAAAVANTRGQARVDAVAGGAVRVLGASVTSASGASLTYGGQGAILTADGLRLAGTVAVAGGGLPDATVRFDGWSGVVSGVATIAPYAAGDAALRLTPVRFSNANGWQVATRATLSGPLGDGRVEALTLPIDAAWRDGVLTLRGGCTPIGWQRVAVAGLVLDPGGVTLCPDGRPLVRVAGGVADGGARLVATRVTGRLGATPLTLAAAGARLRLGTQGFALTGVDAGIGAAGRVTRLTAATLDGRIAAGGVAGTFAGAGGQIANVPLAMSAAAGRWRFAGGALNIDGALSVADTATPARFQPMAARDVMLRLAGNRITADGVLHEPTTGTRVADVAIRHDLATGRGAADLTVPGLSFVKGFQPELLTRLTFGVIADVRGTVTGDAHLAWTPAGVTSTGVFRTAGTDLAAAFGPVTGLAGEIRFTDLLQLQSAPGQHVTIKSINPGVPVTDGVVTFQTLPGTRVQVEGGRWPFAGGALTLDPTLLDFAATAERRLTFRVVGAEADKFLQSFDFKNLDATGTFDGVLPMVFDASGGRIEDGRLAVRPGGGTIAYVGDISRENLGFWGNFAFEALKSLRYRSLAITMNGPLAGEMVTEVRFAGIGQGKGAKSNFIIRRLQRLPIAFNIRIKAPFRGLLDSTASFYDPKRLIERNLPELIQRQQQTIQPPASEPMPLKDGL